MRRVTFGCASSLDNFIARKHHEVDWLLWSDEVAALVSEYWQSFDTVLMGRKTYDVALKSGTPAYPGVKNYVFSRTLKESPDKRVKLVSENAVEFLRQLKKKKGKGIYIMGGGELGRSFLEADLIDEIGVNIHPVLLGSGIPLFYKMKRQIDLELKECRMLPQGCVYLLYNVKR